MLEESIELFKSEKEKFNSYFTLEGNRVQFLSGKFGMGKSTFLQKFFADKKDDYEVTTLYPVNYVVADNDDVVKYLKYDLLRAFIEKSLVELNEFSFKEKATGWLAFNPAQITFKALESIIKIYLKQDIY